MINDKLKSLTSVNKEFNSLNNRLIHFLTISKSGNILIGSDGGGIIEHNPVTNEFISIVSSESESSILSNTIYSILAANDGVIWIGCWGAGVSIYDERFNKFRVYRQEEANPNSISGNQLQVLLKTKMEISGSLLMVEELIIFNPVSKKIVRFKSKKEGSLNLSNDKVLALCTDNDGHLWSGMWNGGINCFKIENDKLILKKYFRNVNPSSTNYSSIFKLFCDNEGKNMGRML
jgi:ligand-binding sensor domain-containing protein